MFSAFKYMPFIFFCFVARAELTIFEVRKNLPMADNDPIYRDFIINGGSEAGLSVGMVVTVERRMPLYDSYQNRSAGDLQLKVAKIKIIHVQKGMAVARMQSEFSRDTMPILEDNFIMVGDRLDMGTASGGDKKAENSGSGGGGEARTVASPPTPPPAPATPSSQPVASAANITVNSVELSSKATPKPTPTPEKVDLKSLQ